MHCALSMTAKVWYSWDSQLTVNKIQLVKLIYGSSAFEFKQSFRNYRESLDTASPAASKGPFLSPLPK